MIRRKRNVLLRKNSRQCKKQKWQQPGRGSTSRRLRNHLVGNKPLEAKKIYVQNITVWGPSSKKVFANQAHDLVVMPETHAPAHQSQELLQFLDSHGWKGILTPATLSPKATNSGGLIMGARKRWCTHSFRHLAADFDQTVGLKGTSKEDFVPGPIDFRDFCALQWRLASISVTFIGVYLTASVGMAGVNIRKLAAIGALIRTLKGPWILAGDFNMPPEVMAKSSWLNLVHGTILVPWGPPF